MARSRLPNKARKTVVQVRERSDVQTKSPRTIETRANTLTRRATRRAATVKERRLFLGSLLLIVVTVIIVFGRIVGHDFVIWDDTIEVYQNPYFNPITWNHLSYLWTHPYLNLYVPISDVVFALLSAVGHVSHSIHAAPTTGTSLDPHVFHAASLVLHMVNSLVVFGILRQLRLKYTASLAGALLFAVHPLQVESVAWVSELRGLTAGLFSLLAVWSYLTYAQRATGSRPSQYKLFAILAVTSGVVAALAKPSAVTVPLIALVLDRWCLRRTWRKCLPVCGVWLATMIPIVVVTRLAQPVQARLIVLLWDRPFVALDALAFYAFKFVWPLKLGIDYGRTPAAVLGSWWGYVTWIVPVSIGVGLYFLRHRGWPVAAGLISLAALLPVLGLSAFSFQVYSTVADRYMYLAMLGPAVALGYLLSNVDLTRLKTAAPLVLVLAGLATLAFVQVGYWSNTNTLMTQALRVNPRSDVAYNNLGISLAQHGHLGKAKIDFTTAMRLNPNNYEAPSNLGNVLGLEGNLGGAIKQYRASILIDPNWPESHTNLGSALLFNKERAVAIHQFLLALRADPGWTAAQQGLQRAQYSGAS